MGVGAGWGVAFWASFPVAHKIELKGKGGKNGKGDVSKGKAKQ